MKSSVSLISSMSPGRMSIRASVFSCSRYAVGYVPFTSGSRNQTLVKAWRRSAAARSSALSVAGYIGDMLNAVPIERPLLPVARIARSATVCARFTTCDARSMYCESRMPGA